MTQMKIVRHGQITKRAEGQRLWLVLGKTGHGSHLFPNRVPADGSAVQKKLATQEITVNIG